MTLKRLLIVLSVLIVLAGGGMFWLARVAYTPQGRARIIIAQLKGDETSLHGWLLKRHIVRSGFTEPPEEAQKVSPSGEIVNTYSREIAAADEMANLGRETLPVAMEGLQDGNRNVRMVGIRVCGKLRATAAIQSIASCMRNAPKKPIDASANKPLFANTPDIDDVQLWCLESLAEIGPEAYGPLMEASKECDDIVRIWIPETLAKKWGSAAVLPLIELLEGSDYHVRQCAASELGGFKDKRAVEALVRRLGDDEVGPQAAKALGEIGDLTAIPALLRTLKDTHVDNTSRICVAEALAKMGHEDGYDFLMAMLKSPDRHDRANAAKRIGELRIKKAFDPLLSLLGDKEDVVRRSAVSALGEFHDPSAIPPSGSS